MNFIVSSGSCRSRIPAVDPSQPERRQRVKTQAAFKTSYFNIAQRITVARNNIFFKPLLRAYKNNLRIRAKFFYLVGNGKRRVNMPACTAAGKYNLHFIFPPQPKVPQLSV